MSLPGGYEVSKEAIHVQISYVSEDGLAEKQDTVLVPMGLYKYMHAGLLSDILSRMIKDIIKSVEFSREHAGADNSAYVSLSDL
jgi:hypothetical protein